MSTEGPVFMIQRLYVKNASFEAPKVPEIFKEEWKPEVNVDLQTNTVRLEENIHEISLHITVTVKMNAKTAFLAEVQQGGIFTIKGFNEEQMGHIIGSECPKILYPYAREAISDLVIKGGFPQLLLAPVNFDAMYLQHLEEQRKGQVQTDATTQ